MGQNLNVKFRRQRVNKTFYLEFRAKNFIDVTLVINYLNKTMAKFPYTKFLGLVIDETLTWNNHIDQLISRLNSVCYAIRAVEQCRQGKV